MLKYKMTEHPEDLLPFFINQTLSDVERSRVAAHLAGCAACRKALVGWEKIASSVSLAEKRQAVNRLPPLSACVRASLLCRASLREAVCSAWVLIWAQRVFIGRTWVLPSLAILIILAALAAFLLLPLSIPWANLPLFALLPMAAALVTAFLFSFDDDPASELILAAPTSLAALLYARLTLSLAAISLLGLAGNLPAAFSGQSPGVLLNWSASWFGPMLVLSALTTVLSLCLHPRLASGTALALWGGLLLIFLAEFTGKPLLKVSLLWLINPGWTLFLGQVVLAVLLYLAAWNWQLRGTPRSAYPKGLS
jgi:hypothetical protein